MILRKYIAWYKLTKSQEKINHIELFAKNEKECETLIHIYKIYSDDIEVEFCMEECAMLIMKSGKRELTEERELLNQEKNQNAR